MIVKKHNAALISFYELLFGVVFVTIFIFSTDGFSPSFFDLSNLDWIYITLLASICTAYAFVISVKIMKHLTPYTVMLTINLEPVYAIILALLIFGDKEKMSTPFYFGALIILTTVITNGILKNKKKT